MARESARLQALQVKQQLAIQALTIAGHVKKAGAHLFRGGAFKPRTSPYSFQGLGEEGFKILAQVRKTTGLPVVTEVMDFQTFDLVEHYADVVQIGTRNMQNFSLLKRAGESYRPILLKRGMAATIEEWLMAAEYIMARGNHQVRTGGANLCPPQPQHP